MFFLFMSAKTVTFARTVCYGIMRNKIIIFFDAMETFTVSSAAISRDIILSFPDVFHPAFSSFSQKESKTELLYCILYRATLRGSEKL